MDLPQRKPTRLKGYDYSTNGAYFITICTDKRQRILCDIVGDGDLDVPIIKLTEIGKIVDTHIISANKIKHIFVDKYVIMPNHIHMIVFVRNFDGTSRSPSPTNAIIPHMVSTFKRFVNSKVGKNIFQRSFHDHIIRDKNDYYKIWNYIDTNPAKWKDDCFYTDSDSDKLNL